MIEIPGYRIESEIARGGMGVVYRARDARSDEPLAIKVLTGHDLEDYERFRREAQVLTELEHPVILHARAYGVSDGKPYLVTDLVAGEQLQGRVDREGPLPEPLARKLGARLAEALAHAHERGVLHRDLKPSNVILQPTGEPILVDFGVAKRERAFGGRLTQTGAILGTPTYMAPEQAMEAAEVGPAADLYGLGATLFFLLAGKAPFSTEGSTLAILTRVATEQPRKLRSLRPDLSPDLEAVITRCMAKDPRERYTTALELRDALQLPGRSGVRAARLLALVVAGLALGGIALLYTRERSAVLVDPEVQAVERSYGIKALAGVPPRFDPAALRASLAALGSESGSPLERGVRLALLGDHAEAEQVFARGLEGASGAGRAELLAGQGYALEAQGELARAWGAFGGAWLEAQAPRWDEARRRVWGRLLRETDATELGSRVGRALTGAGWQREDALRLGDALVAAGQREEALGAYSAAIASDPGRVEPYLLRGRARLELQGESVAQQALADFDRARQLAPDRPEPHRWRARAWRQLGDVRQVEAALVDAVRRCGNDGSYHLELAEFFREDHERTDRMRAVKEILDARQKELTPAQREHAEALLEELGAGIGR